MQLQAGRIIITGAARGLGRTMAETLARAGARIGLIDLDAEVLDAACNDLPGDGHVAAVADVSDEAAVSAAFDTLGDGLGGIDALIANAGITRDALLVKTRDGQISSRMSLEQWRAVLDVNLTGVFLSGREAASRMIAGGSGGVIVNIASISRHGNFGQSNYAAAKAGVAAMTLTWAQELARHGIRAVSVSPGFAATELVARMPQRAIERITARIPARRLAEPAEIAHAVRFVLENEYVNGRDIAVDGGLRL